MRGARACGASPANTPLRQPAREISSPFPSNGRGSPSTHAGTAGRRETAIRLRRLRGRPAGTAATPTTFWARGMGGEGRERWWAAFPFASPSRAPSLAPLLPRHAADPLQVKRWLSLISPRRKGWRTGTLSAEVSRSASRPRQAPKRKPLHPVNPLGASRRAEKGGSCRRRRHRRGDGDARKGGPAPPPFPAHLSVRGARARLRKGMPGRRLHISTATPSHGQRWGGGVG